MTDLLWTSLFFTADILPCASLSGVSSSNLESRSSCRYSDGGNEAHCSHVQHRCSYCTCSTSRFYLLSQERCIQRDQLCVQHLMCNDLTKTTEMIKALFITTLVDKNNRCTAHQCIFFHIA